MSIEDQDREMQDGFGAALALTEEAVSKTTEQMALPPLPMPVGTQYGPNRTVLGHTYTAEQMRAYAIAACRLLAEQEQEPLYVIFDGPPGHEGGRFVEVETASGRSVSVGNWTEYLGDAQYWRLGPFYAVMLTKEPMP